MPEQNGATEFRGRRAPHRYCHAVVMTVPVRSLVVVGLMTAMALWARQTTTAQDRPVAVPTFNQAVAPIVFSRCVECHRPGEAAPMSLMSYELARPWARAIKARVL